MKYILMMNCPKTGYDSFGSMPKNDITAHIAFQQGLDKALRESGELVSAEGLADRSRTACSRNPRSFLPATGSSTSTARNKPIRLLPGHRRRRVSAEPP